MAARPIAFACLIPVAGIAQAQLNLVSASFSKSSVFNQTSNDLVVPTNSWILNIRVTPRYFDTVFAKITAPFLATMVKSPSGNTWGWNSTVFPSRAGLDQAFPDEPTYSVQVAFSTGTTPVSFIPPGGPKLPQEPPRFVGNAYDSLQGTNPNQDIELSLDSFALPATAAAGETRLDVRDLDHNVFVFSALNPGNGAAQFTIPAGTLKPETAYYVQATRTGRTVTPFIGFVDTLTVSGDLSTQLIFITRRCVADLTGDGVSDLEDFFAFFNCWDISSPCADLDGTPGVDLGDFFAFFDAFDGSC